MEKIDDTPATAQHQNELTELEALIPPQGFCLTEFYTLALKLCAQVELIHRRGLFHGYVHCAAFIVSPDFDTITLLNTENRVQLAEHYVPFENFSSINGRYGYLAPEHSGLIDEPLGQSADLYSLGVCFYRLLSGSDLNSSASARDTILQSASGLDEKILKLDEVMDQNPPPLLISLLRHLLLPYASSRPDNIADVKAQLERLQISEENRSDNNKLEYPFDVDRLSQSLFGREEHVERLVKAINQLGQEPRILSITGSTASGKSRLLQEAILPAMKNGHYVIRSKACDKQQQRPYLALKQALRQLLPQLIEDIHEEKESWQQELNDSLPNGGLFLKQLVGEYHQLLPNVIADEDCPVYLRANLLQQSVNSLLNVLDAHGKKLVWVLDDCQWLDLDSLDLLQRIFDAQHKNVLIIMATREEDQSSEQVDVLQLLRAYHSSVTAISLASLPFDATMQWLDCRFPNIQNCALGRKISDQLILHSRGNPSVIQGLLAEIKQRSLVFWKDQKWQADLDAIASISDCTAYEYFSNCIKDLPSEEFQALSACGVLFGCCTQAKYDLLHQAFDLSPETLGELRKKRLIRQQGNRLHLYSDCLLRAVRQLTPKELNFKLHMKLWIALRKAKESDLGDWVSCLDQVRDGLGDQNLKLQLLEHNFQYAEVAKLWGAPHSAEHFIRIAMQLFDEFSLASDHPLADRLFYAYGEILAVNGKLSESDKYFHRLHDSTNDAHEQDLISQKQYQLMVSLNQSLQTQVRQKKYQLNHQQKCLMDNQRNLIETQKSLLELEKMAALGGLVAGVTHEINTPIGISITGMSHFIDRTKQIKKSYYAQTMRQEELEGYFDSSEKAADITFKNLLRAADLIRSFKRISADQSTELESRFYFMEYLNEILVSLSSQYRKRSVDVIVVERKDFKVKSHPGWFSQIFTNFIMNSLIHAFEEGEPGEIKIEATIDAGKLHISYRDNGNGIPQDQVEKIFDPFYTTNRDGGGTGLGLSVIRDIVCDSLHGEILCSSVVGEGVLFEIILSAESLDITELE